MIGHQAKVTGNTPSKMLYEFQNQQYPKSKKAHSFIACFILLFSPHMYKIYATHTKKKGRDGRMDGRTEGQKDGRTEGGRENLELELGRAVGCLAPLEACILGP